MGYWTKLTAALAAPALLSGCLFLPGEFDAKLKLMDGGAYEFSYVGQMQIMTNGEKDMSPPKDVAFNASYAKCTDYFDKNGKKTTSKYYDNYSAEYQGDSAAAAAAIESARDAIIEDASSTRLPRTVQRECTTAELTEMKTKEAERFAKKQKEYETMSTAMASAFGGAVPGNDKALKKFAENMRKYDGWEKIEYVGDNMFDVEYSARGKFDRYFAFPILNDAAVQYPFFQIVPRKSGELEIVTPALGGSNSFLAMAMMGGSKGGRGNDLPVKNISGTLTLETDGELIVNNSADGYTEKGRIKSVVWNVETMTESPRALIRFK